MNRRQTAPYYRLCIASHHLPCNAYHTFIQPYEDWYHSRGSHSTEMAPRQHAFAPMNRWVWMGAPWELRR